MRLVRVLDDRALDDQVLAPGIDLLVGPIEDRFKLGVFLTVDHLQDIVFEVGGRLDRGFFRHAATASNRRDQIRCTMASRVISDSRNRPAHFTMLAEAF